MNEEQGIQRLFWLHRSPGSWVDDNRDKSMRFTIPPETFLSFRVEIAPEKDHKIFPSGAQLSMWFSQPFFPIFTWRIARRKISYFATELLWIDVRHIRLHPRLPGRACVLVGRATITDVLEYLWSHWWKPPDMYATTCALPGHVPRIGLLLSTSQISLWIAAVTVLKTHFLGFSNRLRRRGSRLPMPDCHLGTADTVPTFISYSRFGGSWSLSSLLHTQPYASVTLLAQHAKKSKLNNIKERKEERRRLPPGIMADAKLP